jgi:hypothetical protein
MNKDETLGVALVKEACPLCGAVEDGPIVMNTRLSKPMAKKVEAMHGKVVGYMDKPCTECQKLLDQGFLLIGAIEEKTDDPTNPWRSGHQWVVTHEYANRLFDGNPPKQGASFIDVKVAKTLGLPVADLTPKGSA